MLLLLGQAPHLLELAEFLRQPSMTLVDRSLLLGVESLNDESVRPWHDDVRKHAAQLAAADVLARHVGSEMHDVRMAGRADLGTLLWIVVGPHDRRQHVRDSGPSRWLVVPRPE